MTDTPGDRPQDRPHDDATEDTTPSSPGAGSTGGAGSTDAGWQEQWQPQYPGYGTSGPGAGPGGAQYAPPPQGQYAYQAPEHPKATTVLVLGILSVVLCQVLGPFAWIQGKRVMEEIDGSGGRYGGRGQAQAGYVLGIVGTVILGFSLLIMVAWLMFAIFAVGGVLSAA